MTKAVALITSRIPWRLQKQEKREEAKKMTSTLFTVPPPPQIPLYHRPYTGGVNLFRSPSKLAVIPLCSSSSSGSASVIEDGPSLEPDALPVLSESELEEFNELPRRGCKACGRVEIEKGCNGEGRIQGGIATVPGFGWWPIKAYRPCPGFVASGGRYRRQGQSMDEVVSGGGAGGTSVSRSERSKKKESPRKFKT